MNTALRDLVRQTHTERQDDWATALSTVDSALRTHCRVTLQPGEPARAIVGEVRQRSEEDTLRVLEQCAAQGHPLPTTVEEVEHAVPDLTSATVVCTSTRGQALLVRCIADEVAQAPGIHLVEVVDHSGLDLPLEGVDVQRGEEGGCWGVACLLVVDVEGARPALVELCVVTRLQQAWAELTEQHLYGREGELEASPLRAAVAHSMAVMLHEVDRLADHLAEETEAAREGSAG